MREFHPETLTCHQMVLLNASYKGFIICCALLCLVVMLILAWGGFGIWLFLFSLIVNGFSPFWFSVFIISGPISAVPLALFFSDSIKSEAELVRLVGEDRALWATVDGFSLFTHPAKRGFKELVWSGHDESGVWLETWARTLNLPQEIQQMVGQGAASLGSVMWSRMIIWLDTLVTDVPSGVFSILAFFLIFRKSIRAGYFWFQHFFLVWLTMFVLLYHVPPEKFFQGIVSVTWALVRLIVQFQKGYVEPIDWLKWRLTSIVIRFTALAESVNSEFSKHHSINISRGSTELTNHLRVLTMRATIFINDLSLPSFVRRRFPFSVDVNVLNESLNIMRDLGWPVDASITDPHPVAEQMGFKEWLLCGSDFRQGIHNLKVQIDEDLESLRIAGVSYRRSEEYASIENELESTSRYFKSPKYDFPDLALDDVWYVVGDIFRHSRLTSFNYIIRMWEKKYALGAFMRDPLRPWRKYKRSAFIRNIGGYRPFKALWASTFRVASHVLPVSAVSVKGEALPEKKWASNLVRTVIGSPITQYIMSTVWNYGPNHTFAWESTPIKIGMPLNGYWMSSIWARHARCQLHIEGDFTAFDSTVSSGIMDLIKAVRKKGFESHKDRDRIANLIDVNYEQVEKQLLQTTSTGNVYLKGTGLTTGHSSTSMDNSLALVIIYLMAWKDVTGPSAREFMYYNELSCFGDDHVLSCLASKPAVWTPKNIANVMKRWGLTNNLEVKPSLSSISFLSKWGRKATPNEVKHLLENGVDSRFIVWHDKKKLVGKLTAPITNKTPSYRLKRLLSYLTLTAHHQDVYDGLVKVICGSKSLMAQLRNDKLRIPSYRSVLRNWYSPSPPPQFHDEVNHDFDESTNDGRLIQYGEVSALDAIFGALSMVPDLLSPLLFNYGYMRALQVFLKSRLEWIIDLVSMNNNIFSAGLLESHLARTPYRFIERSIFLPGLSGCNNTTLMVRHWLFCAYMAVRPKQRFGAWFNFAIARISSLQFFLNCKIMTQGRQNELQLDLLVVASLLSLISLPDWLPSLGTFNFPDVQLLVDSIMHYFTVLIWSNVPPNFKETTPTLRTFDRFAGPLGVSAPTGSGKSTGFIQHLYLVAGHRFRKIVVVEPRTLLVHGLTNFMKSAYGLDCSGATTGLKLDKSKRVIYATPQALMNHLDLFSPDNLFVLDEVHINDHFYDLFRNLFVRSRLPCIFVSATLPSNLAEQCQAVLDIPMANLWTTTETVVKRTANKDRESVLRDYEAYLLDLAGTLGPSSRMLAFVPTKAMAERLANKSRSSALALHSDIPVPTEWKVNCIFATPVADVGITIPEVTLVVTPNFTTLNSNGLSSLSGETSRQRRGRTGRTCNGEYRLIQYDIETIDSEWQTCFTPIGVQRLLLAGVPTKMLSSLSSESVIRAFGVPPPPDSDSVEAILRDVDVFLNNFRPVFLAHQVARDSGDPLFGAPVNLHATGIGNISSSFPQPDTGFDNSVIDLVSEFIKAKSGSSTIKDLDTFVTSFDRMAGPILRVGNLFRSLLDGEKTDAMNPKNSSPTGVLEEVYALKDIYKILQSLEEVA
ncbi:replicase [Neofusicoccum luteum fusarivirus 1]|uniref:Replicase n=1 Tax=Neofusicoccum luteum fusarivirus 1 TaxID=1985188 RepID=A0ABN4ZDA8_9VIRU|nr:replicase [Neofusicoccum luteum fusarivirus 1]ARO52688.1 replicase [Neofusicoccum luteum fusarivirus 1]